MKNVIEKCESSRPLYDGNNELYYDIKRHKHVAML